MNFENAAKKDVVGERPGEIKGDTDPHPGLSLRESANRPSGEKW
jgi:hypothetical protein